MHEGLIFCRHGHAGLALKALPYDRLRSLPVAVSGLWLADNQLSHCPNLFQELLESFPSLSTVDLEGNNLTCDHLRLLPSAEQMERRRNEERLVAMIQRSGCSSSNSDSKDSAESRDGESATNRVSGDGDDERERLNLEERGLSPCRKGHCHDPLTRFSSLSCFFCSVRVCYFDCNKLTTLPPELFTCLPNLRWLTAQRNQLRFLPPEVGRATNLEGLRLDSNLLRELPKEIGQLHNLLCLSVGNNNLQSLPEELAGLRRLETLMVHGNPELRTLPSCLQGRLPHLVEFNADRWDTEDQHLPLGTQLASPCPASALTLDGRNLLSRGEPPQYHCR